MKKAGPSYKKDSKDKKVKSSAVIGGKCPKGCRCTTCKSVKAKPKKKRAESEWVRYVKEYAKLNNISYGDAMKQAGPSYREQA